MQRSWIDMRRGVLLCLALALLFSLPLIGQTVSGTIQGTVTDSTGAALPGVTITIRDQDTGFQRVVVTNERGNYSAPFVPIGKYRIHAELAGMNSAEKTNVDVGLNFTRVADFTLQVSGVAETITVTAEEPRINTVNAEIKATMTEVEIIDKPSPPRNANAGFLTLAETFAGFMENPTSGQNNPTASSGSSINFGVGTRGTSFQINGVNNDDSSENQHRQGVTLSAIKEFQVLTSNYGAEFGRGYGAVVLVQTKQGTNEFSGDFFGYYNDNTWNEKSYFNRSQPKPENTREIYGLTSGFPILRDKLFGFLTYEENTYSGQSLRDVDIFTAEELALPRLTRGNDTPENRKWIEDFLARFPNASPNNPAISSRTYSAPYALDQPDDDYSVRLDWDASLKNHVTGRWQASNQLRSADEVVAGENVMQNNEQATLGVTWTQVYNDWLVGEARYGLAYRDTNVTLGTDPNAPIVRFTGTPGRGSIVGNAGFYPILREQTDHQLVYNLNAMLFENHSLKAGFDLRRGQLDDRVDNYDRGYWVFNRVCGGTTYADPYKAFLDGCVQQFIKGYGPNTLENELDEDNAYIEDSWQALSNLTLVVGARYEMVAEPQESKNRLDYGYSNDSYVDPRFAFAYTIDKDLPGYLDWITGGANRSVIRGGWGAFHGRVFQAAFSQGGASVRSMPPNALIRWPAVTHSLDIADPDGDFTFTPGTWPTTRIGTYWYADPELEMPSTEQWNLTFEREMPWNSSMRLTYTNKTGDNLIRYVNGNLPLSPANGPVTVVDDPRNAPAAGMPDLRGKTITKINPNPCAGTGLPGYAVNATCPEPVPLADDEISARVPRINERRPDPRFGSTTLITNGAQNEYQSYQVEWIKRFSDNLHFQASYTWSEEFDNTSEATYVGAGDTNANGPNQQYAWGRSRFDTPHRVTIYGSYRLPWFANRKDILGYVLGGWQIAPVYRFATGTPFTVTGPAVDLDLDAFSESRPVLLQDIEGRKIDNPSTSQQELPASAFRRQTFGDTIDMLTHRNAFRIDDTERLDVSLSKNFELPYGMTFALRGDVFNVTNFEQWGFPTTDFTSTSFGRISSMAAGYMPRTFQLGMRLIY